MFVLLCRKYGQWWFSSCLFKQIVAILYSHGGAEKTTTEHFLWNSSMQSLETQLLKPLAYLPSQNDFSETPPLQAPRFPLLSHRRWVLDKRGTERGGCTEKTDQYRSRCSHTTWAWAYNLLTQAQATYTHVKIKTYCMGWQDWAFCSPGPQVKRRGPGPLGC